MPPTSTPHRARHVHSPRGARHRAVALLAGLMIGVAATGGLAACSSEGANTECSVDACTVTFDRTVENPSASILGIEVKLVKIEGPNVTLSVAGTEVTVPVNQPTQVGNFEVTIEKVTDSEIVVKVATGGGGG